MQNLKFFNQHLRRRINKIFPGGTLRRAAEHIIFPGGKRLRPLLALIFGEAFKADKKQLLDFACALEMIHNYTLIHDDLPAMDNDDWRRGKPTVHKKFGEAAAILAGDALLTQAFELLGNFEHKISAYIARLCGARGVILGQSLDLGLEKNQKKNEAYFLKLYELKTARLFEAAIVGAALVGTKRPNRDQLKKLKEFSKLFGLCFQLVDDLADAPEGKVQKSGLIQLLGRPRVQEKLALMLKNLRQVLADLPLPKISRRQLKILVTTIFGSVEILPDFCHSRESGNPVQGKLRQKTWTPAFAGVTRKEGFDKATIFHR